MDYFELIKESVDRACSTNIADIVITGDFNIDMSHNNNNKIKEHMLEYNINQLNSRAHAFYWAIFIHHWPDPGTQ